MEILMLIIACIGIVVCTTGSLYFIMCYIDQYMAEKREKKEAYERRVKDAEIWLGKWGA